MKHLAQFLLCCLIALPVTARSGGGAHGGGGSHGVASGGFHGSVGGFRGGYGGYRGGYGGYRNGNGFYRRYGYSFGLNYRSGFYGSYYGYPYYGVGFWGYGLGDWGYPYNDYGYSYPSYVSDYSPPVIVYPPLAQYAPPEPVHPEIHEYPETPPMATIRPAGEPPIYLIAIKGQDNILAGIAYWVEGDTLQYINLQHVQKHVPLSSIDRALSARLNQERDMDLRLPPAP